MISIRGTRKMRLPGYIYVREGQRRRESPENVVVHLDEPCQVEPPQAREAGTQGSQVHVPDAVPISKPEAHQQRRARRSRKSRQSLAGDIAGSDNSVSCAASPLADDDETSTEASG